MISKTTLSIVLDSEVTDIQRLDDIRILGTEFYGWLIRSKKDSFLTTSRSELAESCKLWIQEKGFSISIIRGKSMKFNKKEVCLILRKDFNLLDSNITHEDKIFEKFFYVDGYDESAVVFNAAEWLENEISTKE